MVKLFPCVAGAVLGFSSVGSSFAVGNQFAKKLNGPMDSSTLQMARAPNGAIKLAGQGMGLLSPLFKAEAAVQAAVLGKVAGIDEEDVLQEIMAETKKNSVVIYTYGLSPFSSEAVAILDASGYPFKKIELGLEWFLLGGKESQTRVTLGSMVDNGATSLPKIFIGGKCIGGCSELAALVETDELDNLMKKARVKKVVKK
jgi:glutaredoxin-related protein